MTQAKAIEIDKEKNERKSNEKINIDIIKETIAKNTFPFKFEPEKWEGIKTSTNCYAYILNLMYPDDEDTSIYQIGAFSGHDLPQRCPLDILEETLIEDITALGLSIKKSTYEEKVENGSYKICLTKFGDDFHLFRCDEDGTWSHKRGWRRLPENKYEGEKIQSLEVLEKAMCFYKVIGFYIISH